MADDNVLYWCEETVKGVIEKLQSDIKVVLEWFGNNQMMANLGRFQYMSHGKRKSLKIETKRLNLESAKSVEFLGLTIDHNIAFDTHVSSICRTASTGNKNLSRIMNVMEENRWNYSVTILFCRNSITVL